MMNPSMIFKLQGLKNRFVADHPKFPNFLMAVQRRGMEAGTVISIEIEMPDGEKMSSNLKLNEADIEAYRELLKLQK